ncbi:acetyltransferase-like isoleucine patch superfamily enzyme [Mucilaginibacter sp. OAE612]
MLHKIFRYLKTLIKMDYFSRLMLIKRTYRHVFTQFYLKFFFNGVGKKAIVFKQNILVFAKGITLGNNAILLPNSRIELLPRYAGVEFEPKLVLGDNSQIHPNCHITCADSIVIGNDVIVTSNVTITDIIHPHDDINIPINKTKLKTFPVKLGDQTYVYNNSVILPGTETGRHCVIAANSVVSGKYPDYCVIAGAPAKIIKKYNAESGLWEKV